MPIGLSLDYIVYRACWMENKTAFKQKTITSTETVGHDADVLSASLLTSTTACTVTTDDQ